MIFHRKHNLYTPLFWMGILLWMCPLSAQNRYLHVDVINDKTGLPGNNVTAMLQDSLGFVWIGTTEGLCRYNGYEFMTFEANVIDSSALPNESVYRLFLDTHKNVWVTFLDTSVSCVYNYSTGNFTRYITQDAREKFKGLNLRRNLSQTVKWNNKNWSIGEGYACAEDLAGNKQKYILEPLLPELKNVPTLHFADKQGVLWTSASGLGVVKISPRILKIKYFKPEKLLPGELSNNNTRAFCEGADNLLWIGTNDNGLMAFHRLTNTFEVFRANPTSSNKNLIDNRIRCLYYEPNGNLWIGTKSGLSKLNTRKRSFENYTPRTSSKIPGWYVSVLTIDHMNCLWLGAFGGISVYNRGTNTFEELRVNISNKDIVSIIEDAQHRMWLGTQGGGVFCLTRKNKCSNSAFNVAQYNFSATNCNTLSNNRVLSGCIDQNGNLWYGTESGISIIDTKTLKVRRLLLSDGLPDEHITTIRSDQNKFVWVGHKWGVSRIEPNSLKITSFFINHGLFAAPISENASYITPGGEMFMGGQNGFCSFWPDSIFPPTVSPHVVITQLLVNGSNVATLQKINNHQILTQSIETSDNIELEGNENTFSLRFSAMNFSNPKGVLFRYQLEGFDKNAQICKNAIPEASYVNIPTGKYRFMVEASDEFGQWTGKPKYLNVTIEPGFWQSVKGLLLILVMILFLGIGLFYLYRYGRNLIAEKKKTQHLNEMLWRKNQATVSSIKTEKDDTFVNDLRQIVEENLPNPDFISEILAEKMKLSRSRLYRKVEDTTGKSVADFIREARMNKAAWYLLNTDYTISEISYRVGYSVPTNFSRSFTKHFGTSPSLFKNSNKPKF